MMLRLFLMLTVFIVMGCIQTGKRRQINSSEVSAAVDVDGIEPGDQDLQGIAYQLLCNQNTANSYTVAGAPKPQKKTSVDFPAEKLHAGDRCALEITATATESKDGPFKWLAYRKGSPVVGLFYRSNEASVEITKDQATGAVNKYLKLILNKVYAIDYSKDPFFIAIQLKFAKEEGAVIPDKTGMIANLRCGALDAQNKDANFVESTQDLLADSTLKDDERMFEFRLSAAKMRQTTCNVVTVLIDSVQMYEGKIEDMKFSQPAVHATHRTDKALMFGPMLVGPSQPPFGFVNCEARDDKAKCLGVHFDDSEPIWIAVVTAKKASTGNNIDVIVSNALGFRADVHGNMKTIADMNRQIQDKSSSGDYSFFQVGALHSILGANFEPDALATGTNSFLIDLTKDENAMEITSIDQVYTHGFKTVSDGFLNQLSEARWFADVTATDGTAKKRFIIGGGNRYFYTAQNKKPAVSAYFSDKIFRKNLGPSADFYRTYGLKDGGISSSINSCKTDLEFIRATLGKRSYSELNGTIPELDACALADAKPLQFLTQTKWLLAPRFYVWAWHKFDF